MALRGVKQVYAHGSYAKHRDDPNFSLKDLDIIAVTNFDSGDLMAIDAGKDSPLKMVPSEWEDLGFNPDAVSFTKNFLGLKRFGIDHWAASSDGKLLHWGPMAETIEEWKENHTEAEKYAQTITGYNRLKLAKGAETVRAQWHEAYTHSMNRGVSKKQRLQGWLPSDHPANEILESALKLA